MIRKTVRGIAAVLAAVLLCLVVPGTAAGASSEIPEETAITETDGTEIRGVVEEETVPAAEPKIAEESVPAAEPEIEDIRIEETVPAEPSNEMPEAEVLEEPDIAADGAGNIPALQTVQHNAYISGVSADTFQPNGDLTRAQAAQLLYNLLTDTAAGSIDCEFSDVASGSWYFSAVHVLASYGVLNGYADGAFRPNRSITRAEFIKIVVIVAGAAVTENSVSAFPDVPSSSWACDYVAAAAAQGWIGGYTDGSFHPDSVITRAEAVTVLNRVLGRSGDAAAEAMAADALKFTDVLPGAWYYCGVMEAAIPHTYTRDSAGETWQEYERSAHTGWVQLNGNWYYYDSTGTKITGWLEYDDSRYYLDPAQGGIMLADGTYDISGYGRCVFDENGVWTGYASAQDEGIPSEMKACEGQGLKYWLYTPKDPCENMPLIVYLHGGSGKGDELETLLDIDGFPKWLYDGSLGEVPAYVLIPQLPSSQSGWADAGDSIIALIDEISEEYKINRENISLTGHSMGGTGTYAIAKAYPDIFARIAPCSGSINISTEELELFQNTSVWAFVGTADTIVKPQSTIYFVDRLSKIGDAKLTQFEGATHFDVPALVYLDQEIDIVGWLIGTN